MVELHIIKGLLKKEYFNKYFSFIKQDDSLKSHYALLCSMHESTDGDINLDDFILMGRQKGLPSLEDMRTEVSDKTMEELIRIHSERSFCYSLGLMCVEAFEGRRELSDVIEAYSKIEILSSSKIENEFVSDDIEELYNSVKREGGLQWRLPWLNNTIGGLKKGDFGFVFARTNVGKTTFNCSEVSHFLRQAENPVLWVNNEEGGARIKLRLIQSYFGVSEEKLKRHLKQYADKFMQDTHFKLKDSGVIHRRDVERLAKSLQPSLIVIDSLDKIHGFNADRQDIVYGKIYQWARELAKEYCPIIAVCQAGSTAENKRWLDHKDIDSAHTAKGKEADFIVGIGKVNDLGLEDIRFLRQVKNKFQSGEHRCETRINYDIARYEEI